MLILSVLLGIVQIVAASHAASLQRGYRWTASPRDEKVPPLRGVAGRLDRALRNSMETFPLFAAVVLAAHVSPPHKPYREVCAALPLDSRRIRAPLGSRGTAAPFARLECRDARHRAARRRPAFGVMAKAL